MQRSESKGFGTIVSIVPGPRDDSADDGGLAFREGGPERRR